MKRTYPASILYFCLYFSIFVVAMALFKTPFSALQAEEDSIAGSSIPPADTLVVAIGDEPDSLYIYDNDQFAARQVLHTIMDGPITTLDYDYQPVIVEKIPQIGDGDATINAVQVNTNDTVINANGSVVTLVNGETIIDSNNNAVVFDGTPVMMNQMSITFTVKSNIFWSDGVQLTADDSVFSFYVGCHPDTMAFDHFKCDRTESYTAPNATTTRWIGYPGFVDSTYATDFWTPLPEHILGAMAPGDIPNSDYVQHPLGWGPYKIDEWIAGDSIKLSANPFYWRSGEGLPKITNLIFKFYPDILAAQEALLAGEVHFIDETLVSPNTQLIAFENLDAENAINVYTAPGSVWEHIDFDILPYDSNQYVFFDDVEVRRALMLCTDRQSIAETIFGGYGVVADAYIPSEHPLYDTNMITKWDFDPAAGRAKLDAAGWTLDPSDGWRYKNGQRFAVSYKTTTGNAVRAIIASMFKEDMAACGIDVTLEYLPPSELFADGPDGPVFGRAYDLGAFAWLSGIEPSCNLWLTENITGPEGEGFGGWGNANNTGYSNLLFDTACREGLNNLRGSMAYEAGHQEALQIWTSELPVIPVYWRLIAVLSNGNLLNVQLDSTEGTALWNVGEWEFAAEATATVAGGGSVTSNDGRVTLTAPSNAFTETVTLRHAPVAASGPEGLYDSGQIFELAATYDSNGQSANLTNNSTYTLSVSYSPLLLNQLGTGASGLALYYWDGSQWVIEPTSQLDLANQRVIATPNHLSVWGLFSETTVPIYLPLVAR